MTSPRSWRPGTGLRALGTRVLGLVGMVSLLACEGAGNGPAEQPPEGYRSNLATHKVQLTAEQARQLEQSGASAQVIADYGAFKLVQVDDKALASLPEGAEPRDDYNDILLNAGVIDTASEHGQKLRGVQKQAANGKRFHLVQFSGPVRPEWYSELEATGVQIVTYIPNNAYLVYGDAPTLGRMQQTVNKSSRSIQWDGAYLDDYKLNPSIHTVKSDTYEVQLIKDEEANSATLELIRTLQSRNGTIQEALGYVNVTAYLTVKDLYEIATRPDVLSIQPRPMPRMFDERQNMIVSGNLTGNLPNGPGWMAWLASKGFTQAQFTASGFGVDVTDSGVDNANPAAPNHFGLYLGGNISAGSRLVYSRLEGTPHSPSTIQGCDGHGNLNAHIIGGYSTQTGAPYADAAGFHYGMGVAPFVKVGSSVIFDPGAFTSPDYEDLQSRAYRDSMRISSNSWGASTSAYTSDAQRYDALARDAQPTASAVPNPGNQEMVIVFAAGNDGPSASTVGSPGTAKNIITAGASENVQAFGGPDACNVPDTGADSAMDIIGFSSRGPTQDGRKKPDLMAPGTHVSGGVAQADGQRANPPANPNGQALGCFDATGVCAGSGSNFFPSTQQWYTASSGTSHSTPAIAGGAALVRQYFINDGKAPPSAAMTKAYLMNSARYMTGVSANDTLWSNNQGMGLMDLGMAFDGVPRLLDDQNPANLFTATGQTRTFNGVVADASKPFRVTLAWTDAPGSTTGSAWRNNLDLTVTMGTNTYRGNVFTGANSVTGGTSDAANNVESVFLPAGASGPYTVTVTATNINSDGVPGNSSTLDQDFALIAYNTCQTAPPVVGGVSASVSGSNSITVAWTANGANSYNVYRSTVAGGPYTKVGDKLTGTSFVDTAVSGGTKYFYVVRGVLCAESPNSTEVSVTATGSCTLPPTFAGAANVTNSGAATCGTSVTWAAGTATCGGTLSYSVYRSTTAGFTPALGNRIATGLTGTSFADNLNLTSGTTYYYVVRATEAAATTVEEKNTVQKSAAPTGPAATASYLDDLDGNRPQNADAYWIPTTDTGTPGTLNVTSGCHYQSATKSWRFGAPDSTDCGGVYPTSTTATLVLGGNGSTAGVNGFTIPTGTPQMQFNIWYSFESTWDGAYLLYSTTGATGPWTQVMDTSSTTAPFISTGTYDGALNDLPSIRVWTGSSTGANGALKPVTVNLNALSGKKVWFAFRFYSEVIIAAEGMYLDDVRVSAQVPVATSCTTNKPPPGPAVSYTITGLPASTQAGVGTTFTVTARDAVGQTATSYTGSASFSSSDAQATLPPTASFTGGVASNVPVTFRTLGAQSVTAKDTVNPAITGSGSTTITAGPAAGLAFKVQPSTTVAGVSINPAVQVGLVDQFGNPVTTGTNTVTIALGNNPGGGTLSGTLTATMTAGVATFSNLSLNKAATGYTLVASATGLTSATSAGFEIKPAPASKLAFLTQPSNSGAGVSITPAVQVALQDSFGNTSASTANVTVALGTNPAGGTLLGTATVAAVNGVATFGNLSITKVGTGYKLDASSGTLTSVSSNAFDISPGPPHRVLLTQQPSDVFAGMAITPAVQATVYDKHANVATQATAPVSVSIGNNPAGGTLSGTTSVVPVNGVATFDTLSVNRVGLNYTLVAGGSGLYSDTSVGFDVRVGAPAELLFTASPAANVVSGAPFTAKVAVRDAGGNMITGAGTQVTLSLNNAAGATLGGTLVATAVNGVATFTGLTVDKAGSGYSLEASAAGVPSVTSPAFGVDPGAPAALVFQTEPSDSTSGAAFSPAVSVAVQDAQGNLVISSAKITVELDSNPSGGTLSGTKTVATLNGVATFADLRVGKAGTGYTLKASSGSLSVTSSAFSISAGAAAQLVFRTAPATTTAGAPMGSIEVELQDAAGNLTTSTAQVSLSLGGASGGTLGGTTTQVAVDGVATFADLFIQQAATGYTLTASVTGLVNVTSGAFDITPAAEAALAFSVQPSNSIAGAAIAPAVKVAVLDGFGNLVTSSSTSVSVALAANASGGTLAGTATAAAVNGVATFNDLVVNRTGTGYTLEASAGTLTGATSAAFEVSAGAAVQLVFKLAPSSTTAGSSLGTVSVELQDAQGNRVNSSASITLSLLGGQGGTLAGTTTVSASGGLATFGDLSIAKAGVGYQLKAQTQQVADAISSAFDIAHGPAATLVYTVQPGNSPAGSPITPAVKVTLQDAFGNVATSATDAITLAIGNNPKNGTLSGTKTVNATNGVSTFADLSINRKGEGYTLVASTGALPSVTSTAFDITPGNGPKLVIRSMPERLTAGEALPSIQVELQDALGNLFDKSTVNVTLSIGDNAAGGQLFGRATVAAANGTAKFDGLSLRRAGTGYTLVASAQGFEGATSTAFNVTPAAAASYALTIPSSATAGQETTLSAAAYDTYGNPAANYGGSVKVTSSDTTATLASTVGFVEGVIQGLKVTFKTPGLRTITITDSAKATLTGTAQINVTPFAQPTVVVDNPAGGSTVEGKVSITATGAVAQGTTVSKLSIFVDGKEIASGTEATLTGTWDTEEVEGGSHVITAVVTDGAGSMVSSAPVIVFTDSGCGCGATSGTDAGIYLALLLLAHYLVGRRRKANAQV